jgi:hypothetical protein
MKIYHYHPETKKYIGEGLADPNPLQKGDWLIPAFATTIEPPIVEENQIAKWNGNSWDVVAIPDEIVPEPVQPTREEQINLVIRPIRDMKIRELQDRVERYQNQIAGGMPTTETPEKISQIYQVMQQLRDFPATCEDPFNPAWPDEGI